MDVVNGINAIRDVLRDNLEDPYFLAGGDERDGSTWIFGDEPINSPKFPRIEIKKFSNPSIPIDIGPNYMEQEELFVNIWFYSKNGFKFTQDNIEYTNSQLVERYLTKIKRVLKTNFMTLAGKCAGSYKHVDTTPIQYDPDTQLYYGFITARVRWFQR